MPVTSGKPLPTLRETQKAATRKRIRQTARRLFAKKSFLEVSMEDIAASANVARTTIYFHYSTKSDLLSDLLAEDWDDQATTYRILVEKSDLTQKEIEAWLNLLVGGLQKSLGRMAMHTYTLSQGERFARLLPLHRERLMTILGERFPAFQVQDNADRRSWIEAYMMVTELETFTILAARDLADSDRDVAVSVMSERFASFVGLATP